LVERGDTRMTKAEESIDVEVPVRKAYNPWNPVGRRRP
jgi:hypothetical protein